MNWIVPVAASLSENVEDGDEKTLEMRMIAPSCSCILQQTSKKKKKNYKKLPEEKVRKVALLESE
jgi:hypothetical protein